ncbi:pyrroline-5-carboxylate reductase ProI [Bacillus songklensis]|uniref:Pyrroline-5-carboxylate reductase n=1 Tax=Bacillus songklensis TaxID=1069116 RepID=A0ABV8AXZ0_9BACI
MSEMKRISFIGAGSMAEAMIAGLLQQRQISKQHIMVTNRSNDERLEYFRNQYGIKTTRDQQRLLEQADIIVLAMKPKDLAEGLTAIKQYVHEHQLIITLLAGISMNSITSLLEKPIPIIRAMPNTSATIGLSATAIAKGEYATNKHLVLASRLFETVGIVSIVEENLLHAVTGLSGSGPAYVYYLVESMEKAAHEIGIDTAVAKDLILQTIIGAAEMLKQSSKEPGVLRKEVTSPGGTTEAGIQKLKAFCFQEGLIECIKRATERSTELGMAIEEEILSHRL